jgi:hypothetical protein
MARAIILILVGCLLAAGSLAQDPEQPRESAGASQAGTAEGWPDLTARGPITWDPAYVLDFSRKYGAPDVAQAKGGVVLRAEATACLLDGKRSVVVTVSVVNVGDKRVRIFGSLGWETHVTFRYADGELLHGLHPRMINWAKPDTSDTIELSPFHTLSVSFGYPGLLDEYAEPGRPIEFSVGHCLFLESDLPLPDWYGTTPWTPIEVPRPPADGESAEKDGDQRSPDASTKPHESGHELRG